MCDVTPDGSFELPNSVQSPSLARSFVKSNLCREHAQRAEAGATLLADELVTQALLYGTPPVTLTLRCHVMEVIVEVADGSPMQAERPQAADFELSMLLVDKIAHSWGIEPTDHGKSVWCRLPSGALPQMRSYRQWPTPRTTPDEPVVVRSRPTSGTGRTLPFDTTSES